MPRCKPRQPAQWARAPVTLETDWSWRFPWWTRFITALTARGVSKSSARAFTTLDLASANLKGGGGHQLSQSATMHDGHWRGGVPLPEKGFLDWQTLELTLHVSLSVVVEAGDGSQTIPGLQHAAIAVLNTWENQETLEICCCCFGFFWRRGSSTPLIIAPTPLPDLYLLKRQNIRNSLAV